ncbi:AAA family ATPase [Propionivibrio sp.]|uniref:AAA family ATPase n=1 Tax=Propionivibrio sp. TaxID=2212460 RepID=UPI003BF0DFFB
MMNKTERKEFISQGFAQDDEYKKFRPYLPIEHAVNKAAEQVVADFSEVVTKSLRDEVEAPVELAEATSEIPDPADAYVNIFDPFELEKLIKLREDEGDERAKRQVPFLQAALVALGTRTLINQPLPTVVAGLLGLKLDMPNFSNVVDTLIAEISLAMSGEKEDFRVSPLCMNGVPGIGKTRFACEVAKILDVGFEAISLGAGTGSFELSGVSAGYSNSRPGRIFRLLAEGKSGCPVVLLDEIDKISSDSRYPQTPVLLDLMEVDSARRFRDEGIEARLDCSKMILLATSNYQESIPAPLKSRMNMVEILAPTAEQGLYAGTAENSVNPIPAPPRSLPDR